MDIDLFPGDWDDGEVVEQAVAAAGFAVDLYRPNFDEEVCGDITTNTRVLWQELWGKDINPRQEIVAPALARLRAGYADDLPRRD